MSPITTGVVALCAFFFLLLLGMPVGFTMLAIGVGDSYT